MSAVFSQLTLADILPALGDDDSLLTADIPLYGRANIRFAKDGSVEDATRASTSAPASSASARSARRCCSTRRR